MEMLNEKNSYMPLPQFGSWDSQAPGATDYSMVFTKARANKKQQKTNIKNASLGNERELMTASPCQDKRVMKKKKIWHCLSCCIRPSS